MITLPDFKKLLGQDAKDLNEQQIKQLYDLEYKIADILFDQWIQGKNKSGHNPRIRHHVIKDKPIKSQLNNQ